MYEVGRLTCRAAPPRAIHVAVRAIATKQCNDSSFSSRNMLHLAVDDMTNWTRAAPWSRAVRFRVR
jgi:hypothetical protein